MKKKRKKANKYAEMNFRNSPPGFCCNFESPYFSWGFYPMELTNPSIENALMSKELSEINREFLR